MYCPKCAAPNDDAGRFCRGCGVNLAPVARALSSDRLAQPAADWLEKYAESRSTVAKGSALLGTSLVIGIVPAIVFLGKEGMAWLAIWTVFFGWLACWGLIALANGLGKMAKAKTMLREMERLGLGPTPNQPSLTIYEPPALGKATTSELKTPLSVTEGTTKLLRED